MPHEVETTADSTIRPEECPAGVDHCKFRMSRHRNMCRSCGDVCPPE